MTSNSSQPDPITDATWLAHRYDAVSDAIQFHHVSRERHRGGPFLTDEYIGDTDLRVVPRQLAVAGAPAAPIHFIFHSAFCASTMLARVLDHPGLAMGLSEPVILNDIVGLRRRGEAQPPQVARLLDDALTLLARPFAPGEAVIVKPSNLLNTLAGAMLALRPEAKAVFLYAPLETFLASVARKGLWCRLWVRELLEGLLHEGAVDLGFTRDDYFRQSDLQVAAVGWLAQHQIFHKLVARFGPDRIATLDSETWIAKPALVVPALLDHFGLDTGVAADVIAGSAFSRHSKSGKDFSPQARHEEQAHARAAHADEIEKVTVWAEHVAGSAGIDLHMPASLIPNADFVAEVPA